MGKGVKILLALLMLAGLSGGVYECKYAYSYYTDQKDRHWVYSNDPNAKLLVGTWQGEFQDPDGVAKTIRLTLAEPVTDEERAQKVRRRSRRRKGLGSQTDKQRFDGSAIVTGKRGQEDYEVWGSVGQDDWHRISSMHFRTADEKRQIRKNFNLNVADSGQWHDNGLTLVLAFTYTTAPGSGYSNSADPRYDKKVTVHCIRAKS